MSYEECANVKNEYQKLGKKVLLYIYIKTIIINVIAILVLTLIRHFIPWKDHYIAIIYDIFVVLSLLEIPIAPYYKYKVYTYKIEDDFISVKQGFLTIVERIVPIERIHNIEIEAGLLLRIFHMAKVTIITAGGKVSISMLDENVADSISEKLRDKINKIVRQKTEDNKKSATRERSAT